MNYFAVLSIVFGVVILVTRVLMHLMPKRWNEFELKKAYTEERPRWVWVAAGLSVVVVGYTWYRHFTDQVSYSLIITLIISLSVFKTAQVLFNYKQFRSFASHVLTKDRSKLVLLNAVLFVFGIAVIGMGVFLY